MGFWTVVFNHCLRRFIFIIFGLAALIWFLIRVLPKPSRATYPCQRIAFPIASSFIVYVLGILSTVFVFRRIPQRIRQARILTSSGLLVGVIILYFLISYHPELINGAYYPNDPPNTPVGSAKGIYPGRVVWVHDPNATSWDGRTGNWWEPQYTDQQVVDKMLSQSIRALTGKYTNNTAWDTLFRYYNKSHNKGDRGYQQSEIIAIKINMNNSGLENRIDASSHLTLSIVRELVYNVGVNQDSIYVYDAVRPIGSWITDLIIPEFPQIQFNPQSEWVQEVIQYSNEIPIEAKGIPLFVLNADYLINVAILKRHQLRTAVTLCGKNHFGSIQNPSSLHPYVCSWENGLGSYDPQVDLMGHKDLGGKTLLYIIDGLYASSKWNSTPTKWKMDPFNNDWPSSLFVSLDPVAIDSVGLDFLAVEYDLRDNADNYLHEAALVSNAPSGTIYDPEGDSIPLESLGVHEHWNNAVDKQYSRNLGTGNGIELLYIEPNSGYPTLAGDIDKDGCVGIWDLMIFSNAWNANPISPNWDSKCDIAPLGGDLSIDLCDFSVFCGQWNTSLNYDLLADFNYDHKVCLDDLLALMGRWLMISENIDWDKRFDLYPQEGDGKINIQDFSIFSNYWLEKNTSSSMESDENNSATLGEISEEF